MTPCRWRTAYVDSKNPDGAQPDSTGLRGHVEQRQLDFPSRNWCRSRRVSRGAGRLMVSYQTLRTHKYQKGISSDLALSRAYQILGGEPKAIPVHTTGQAPGAEFRAS